MRLQRARDIPGAEVPRASDPATWTMIRFGIPILFVLIWSTGFIVAKAASPHADLQLFLVARFALTALVMGAVAAAAHVEWPRGREFGRDLLVGAMMNGVYLCASYWAISRGMSAGVVALLGALQPLFTALFLATAMGIKTSARTWSGMAIGFGGVVMVLAPKLASAGTGSVTLATAVAALLGVMAITFGTLGQQRVATIDLRSAACVQNLGGLIVAAIATVLVGTGHWDGTPVLWGALAWAVLVLSVIGTTLFMWMMRRGEATRVTALIQLISPLVAVQAYFLFNETLSPVQLAGFALALGGVLLARSRGGATHPPAVVAGLPPGPSRPSDVPNRPAAATPNGRT